MDNIIEERGENEGGKAKESLSILNLPFLIERGRREKSLNKCNYCNNCHF